MYLLGHLGAATAAYVLVRRGALGRRAPGPSPALAGLLALAMAPDVDAHLPGVEHRGVTHTVWFAALLGAAAALVAVVAAVVLSCPSAPGAAPPSGGSPSVPGRS